MSGEELGIQRRFRALVALLIGLTLSLAIAESAQALPRVFWGVVPQSVPGGEEFQRLRRGRVGSVRIPIHWNAVQSARGAEPNWSGIDAVIEHATAARIDVLPFIAGAPSWAVTPDVNISSRPPLTLPVRTGLQRGSWMAFVRMAVERYGRRGDFWAEHPELPYRPVRAWQIWNEQNFFYFVSRPNPVDYGKLVKLSETAIHRVDPKAKVVLGGMFAWPGEASQKTRPRKAFYASEFLRIMYRKTPGIGKRFDAVALHPYTGNFKRLPRMVREMRSALEVARDPKKPIWITEMGWSSQPPTPGNGFAKGPVGQVKQLKGAFRLLRKNHSKWRIQRVYWFSVDDHPGSCNFCDGSGLFTQAFKPKRSWHAYVRFTGGKAK